MRKHFNIKVAGRVQGVFFRASTKTCADQHNIFGFVRNEPDGTVYIEAEGEERDLEKFIDWCSHGPEAAIVETCEVEEKGLVGYSRFEVVKF